MYSLGIAILNYPDATRFIYYFAKEASAPFLAGMRHQYPTFELFNKSETEQIMLDSNNVFAFRFIVKYSLSVTNLVKIIQNAYKDEHPSTTPDFVLNEEKFRIILEAHEAIVRSRETVGIAISNLQELVGQNPNYCDKDLIAKTAKVSHNYISILDNGTTKLNGLLRLNSSYVNSFIRGSQTWGSTLNGEFLPLGLDYGDWSRYSSDPNKRHFLKILDYVVAGFRERLPHYNYGVPEVIGCFLCIKDILDGLKKVSAKLVTDMFNKKTN